MCCSICNICTEHIILQCVCLERKRQTSIYCTQQENRQKSDRQHKKMLYFIKTRVQCNLLTLMDTALSHQPTCPVSTKAVRCWADETLRWELDSSIELAIRKPAKLISLPLMHLIVGVEERSSFVRYDVKYAEVRHGIAFATHSG